MKKYCLVSDDSGHDYVIPTDKRNEWYDFDFSNYDFDLPFWARRVEGGLEFENPNEGDKLLFPEDESSTRLLEEIEAWLCFNKTPDAKNINDLHKSIKNHLEIE